MPPSDMRTNSRFSARAIDYPTEGLPVPGARQAGLGAFGPVARGTGRVALADFLADRPHLLAEDVPALLLPPPLFAVPADAAAALQPGEPLALDLQGQLEPLDDVDSLE